MMMPDEGGAGGGAAAPVAVTPSSVEGSPSGGEAASGDAGFEIPSDSDLDSIELEPQGSGESAPAGVGVNAPPAVPAPVSAAPAQAGVQAQPAQPVQAPAQGERSEPVAITLENMNELLARDSEAYVSDWAGRLFALSQEESDLLTTNPEQVLPQLMAKVLFHAVSSIPTQIKNFVPGLIQQTIEQGRTHSEAESNFYAAWPGLKGDDKSPVIIQAIHAVKNAFPALRGAEVYDKVGTVAASMLGLDPALVRSVAASTSGGRPAATQPRSGAVAPPFRPAGAGSVVRGSPNGQGSGSWFDTMDLPFSE